MIILNKGQEQVVRDLVEFYHSTGEHFFILEGGGGVGKSTCIQTAIKEIQASSANKVEVCLTAPTNKATKVLRHMAREAGLEVACRTIYSILGLVLDNNNEIRHTSKMTDGVFTDFDLVVTDECSMLGGYLWQTLHDEAVNNNIKVILVGDSAQLPPVKEARSQIFKKDFRRAKLTQIMRQVDGNPIIALAQTIRDAQADPRKEVTYTTQINTDTEQGIYTLNAKDWTACVLDNFKSEEYKNDPDSFRCLAYTNVRVNSLNRMIRNMLVGQTVSPFIKGERVLVRRPIEDLNTGDKVHTDEECEVLGITEGAHPLYEKDSTNFKVWILQLATEQHSYIESYLLHADSVNDYNTTLDLLGKAAKENGSRWSTFWKFKESFADLQNTHAMTIHRSQGSTYGSTFIDMKNIYKNRNRLERLQLEYVSVTRAKDNLIILEK